MCRFVCVSVFVLVCLAVWPCVCLSVRLIADQRVHFVIMCRFLFVLRFSVVPLSQFLCFSLSPGFTTSPAQCTSLFRGFCSTASLSLSLSQSPSLSLPPSASPSPSPYPCLSTYTMRTQPYRNKRASLEFMLSYTWSLRTIRRCA